MKSPLNMYFLPYISPGHMIPLTEMARLFANQGHKVTIITTPLNANLLNKYTTTNLTLHLIPLPTKETGLGDGLENFISVNDLDTADKLYHALSRMQPAIENFIKENPPDCIVSDMFYPWTADLAVELSIPRIVFHGACIFAMCMKESMRGPEAPHLKVKSDYEVFEVKELPDPVYITRAQLPDYVRTPYGYTQLMEIWREAEKKSYGVMVNNFYELDSAYTDYYSKLLDHKVWNIGPTAQILNRDAGEKAERVHKAVVSENECLSWLDTKEPSSVFYVCFGSAIRFPDEQLYEIACALESSGTQFIWAVLGKEKDSDSDSNSNPDSSWLPAGFEEMLKETGRGMIIRGWAPQALILDHPSVGGFMTHCGWNSTIEGVCAGVAMVTWPLYAEQFYNEKLITQVLKIGVEAGVEDWNLWVDVGKKLVKREKIEAAINSVMGGEGVEMRRNAKELSEKAKKAMEDGGSSHRNLLALIEDLQRIRDDKLKVDV
ncbi:scopoletin glucosyltransferase-like [Silene latifolia]|uniref:scopoletin glucosyltransferase-like n=1 Tax=Silene latifolia TaxID=37657 RepID=UPI003D772F83